MTTRKLRYREKRILEADGSEKIIATPQEKGIDVRLALDIVRLARKRNFGVAVIYSGLRSEQSKLCTLVVIGSNEYGDKRIPAMEDGVRESTLCLQKDREGLMAFYDFPRSSGRVFERVTRLSPLSVPSATGRNDQQAA